MKYVSEQRFLSTKRFEQFDPDDQLPSSCSRAQINWSICFIQIIGTPHLYANSLLVAHLQLTYTKEKCS